MSARVITVLHFNLLIPKAGEFAKEGNEDSKDLCCGIPSREPMRRGRSI
jgi:hypothetical protein